MTQPDIDLFPIECSILSSEALGERVLPHYSLTGSHTCQLLQHGDNDTYLAYQAQNKYILRVWSKDDRPWTEIEAEVELLDFLVQHGVPATQPLKRLDGRFLSEIYAPEGRRFVRVFHHADGRIPR